MSNIREIAKRAGVSITTVSRVLNHHPYVKEEKRKRVLDAIKALEYTRNIHAVHLAKGFSNMIGIVLPTINHSYFSELVNGIAEKAQNQGIHFALFQTNYDHKKEEEALMKLKERQVDGLIFCSKALSDQELVKWKAAGPIVFCHDTQDNDFSSVSIAHEQAFQDGLEHLVSCGHEKLAIVLARKEGINSQVRMKAYKKMMKTIGQEIKYEWIIDGKLTLFDGRKLFAEWRSMVNQPSALLVSNDQVSAGFVLEADRHRVKVGQYPAVLSFDNQQISEMLGISTIEIPIKQMGHEAFELLNQAMNGSLPEKKVLPYRLIERMTTSFKNNR
ncbi:LacI family DNA-binding transcriptional regulator [Bacillus sp. NPDC077027]|uniref:LacI family DNA-binding transcriptional regulator n=1 Tax=Bacillus sp. NPDC077027 TaxID=3390548 RepID=UPI003D03FD71